ncbi:MAG: hypothetical protein ABI207_01775 [Crocinitomicaceae bacterium]
MTIKISIISVLLITAYSCQSQAQEDKARMDKQIEIGRKSALENIDRINKKLDRELKEELDSIKVSNNKL